MEETIFELKNDKRGLATKLYGQTDKLGSRLGSKISLLGFKQAVWWATHIQISLVLIVTDRLKVLIWYDP